MMKVMKLKCTLLKKQELTNVNYILVTEEGDEEEEIAHILKMYQMKMMKKQYMRW